MEIESLKDKWCDEDRRERERSRLSSFAIIIHPKEIDKSFFFTFWRKLSDFHLPNKLFDSAKLLRRWLTFLRLRVDDGETEPSREPATFASRGLLFSMVKPEACNYERDGEKSSELIIIKTRKNVVEKMMNSLFVGYSRMDIFLFCVCRELNKRWWSTTVKKSHYMMWDFETYLWCRYMWFSITFMCLRWHRTSTAAIRETFDLEWLGGFQERCQLVLRDVDFTTIHVIHHGAKLLKLDIL